MNNTPQPISARTFGIFCLGGYLLSIAYGVTFLIPLLVGLRGGDEGTAGLIISAATVSTVLFVILSGHISDRLGAAFSVSVSALFLCASGIGFAFSESAGWVLLFFGFVLGVGWGVFYTLGPILVAAMIEPQRRIKYFALLSGSMMSGIGTGPLVGRLVSHMGHPVETAFIIAAIASLLGGFIFILIHRELKSNPAIQPQASSITLSNTFTVIRSHAAFPIAMVGLGGCIFGGLSSFQTSYAELYDFDYSLFFVGFIVSAISGRLLLAGYVVQKDPFITSFILTGMIVISLLMFIVIPYYPRASLYLLAAIILGIGYGLTYSVINGLAANEAPQTLIPQSLLLFSLSYFIGVFGFPFIAGQLIVQSGIQSMLYALLMISLINHGITIFRIISRRLA